MADYGHELTFGTFITPTNIDPRAAGRLARLTESAGLDLVTFQDHPYQPRFLDTWTLLSLGRRPRPNASPLSPTSLNVPLRPPAVLARAAASLDLLSGGRVDLGARRRRPSGTRSRRWAARRLTPAEAVEHLAEAIEIIRGIWDAGDAAMLRRRGSTTASSARSADRAAAHDIPIWIGARSRACCA